MKENDCLREIVSANYDVKVEHPVQTSTPRPEKSDFCRCNLDHRKHAVCVMDAVNNGDRT